ncbi:hypothetical protein [Halomonas denitrificans]|uniref:WYL domain-containing protein n=1 Tax=Halomonas denitrificans TaxID=370769 RepID=UPI001300A878|nr:hypothetical protein [Halomonas denitrificans]
MEGLIFWVLAGAVLVFMIRRTKRKAREAEADSKRRKEATLQHIQDENRRASRSAIAPHDWKRKAKKAKSKARDVDVEYTLRASSEEGEPYKNAFRSSVSSTQAPYLSGTSALSVDGRLRFIYEDANGNTSAREVSDFSDDGVYIEGFCHSRRAVRTFRRDRVVEYLEGEELLVPMIDPDDIVDEPFADRPGMEILFTGFSEDERFDLESDAEEAGLVVRKTVTKNLMFVCAGPRAGSTKLAKAREQGCTLLDKPQLKRMLLTGELPDQIA